MKFFGGVRVEFRKKMRAIVMQLRQSLEMDQRSFGKRLGKSAGAVQGWEREVAGTFPDFDSLAAIAELRGQLPEELVAELYERTYAPTGDRTWAEIGASLTDEEFEELFQGVDDLTLHRRLVLISQILQDRYQSRQNDDESVHPLRAIEKS